MSTSERLALLDDRGNARGSLVISCLPGRTSWRGISLIERVGDDVESRSGADIRMLEESDYRYRIELADQARVAHLEPSELFSPNDADLLDGRLRTGRVTGSVRVTVLTDDGAELRCEFEVRSRKLDYETEYRRMMMRLAEEGAELLQSSFAAGQFSGFNPDGTDDSRTLYQRFAFLQSLLESEAFDEAIDAIRYRPHSAHAVDDELVDPSHALKPSRRLAQQLVSSGNRQPVHRPVAGLTSLPRAVQRQTYNETFDTTPNRFVRFAFEHWKVLAGTVADLLASDGPEVLPTDSMPRQSAGVARGVREARSVEERLERLLDIPAIAEAGRLDHFPASNTVLHSRAGYREIFRAFLIGEVATSLTWEGGEDVYGAGQRDVATLYEYWVFLELMAAIEAIPGFEFDKSPLVAETPDGMNLELVRGRTVVLTARGERRGRPVELELHFNRIFNQPASWTVQMRPDCSLLIRPLGSPRSTETWVHFDAKYRIDQYQSWSGDDTEDGPEVLDDGTTGTASSGTRAIRADLQKMHAYRDAIRRTAGAYVLYPGSDDERPESLRQYHEVLPGLGAFALRPAANGQASPATASHLTHFLADVIDHAAAQGTSRERAAFWEDEAYSSRNGPERRFDYSAALDRPPADSLVLLGFVRNEEHLEWIRNEKLYNLRADANRRGAVDINSPALGAAFVVLYDAHGATTTCFRTTGALFVRTRTELESTGYPRRPGDRPLETHYLCLELDEHVDLPVSGDLARALANDDASPTVLTWDEIAHAAASE